METTYTIEFMRLAEPPSPQIKQPSAFHGRLIIVIFLRAGAFIGLSIGH
jgi:hypothetical protein